MLPSWVDYANALDENDKVGRVIEMLNETNEILDDMGVMEGNLQDGHKSIIRTGLPSVAWRILNYGVQPSKATTRPVTDRCGMLEAYAEVDKAMVELNGNTEAYRLQQDKAFLESMNQAMVETLFYGNEAVNPERFTGFSARYSVKSTDPTQAGYNIIDAGGTGTDNTSIWLIVWGDYIHGIYPKGTKGGITHQDLGEQTLFDEDGGQFQGYRTHYTWRNGLVVSDWRYAVRIANIDWSDVTTLDVAGGAPDLVSLMIDAVELVPNLQNGRPVFYMRREIRTALRNQIRKDSNVNLTTENVAGKRVVSFDEVKVARVDQLLATESRVV